MIDNACVENPKASVVETTIADGLGAVELGSTPPTSSQPEGKAPRVCPSKSLKIIVLAEADGRPARRVTTPRNRKVRAIVIGAPLFVPEMQAPCQTNRHARASVIIPLFNKDLTTVDITGAFLPRTFLFSSRCQLTRHERNGFLGNALTLQSFPRTFFVGKLYIWMEWQIRSGDVGPTPLSGFRCDGSCRGVSFEGSLPGGHFVGDGSE